MDPDQIWSGSTMFSERINPGSAGQGLTPNWQYNDINVTSQQLV